MENKNDRTCFCNFGAYCECCDAGAPPCRDWKFDEIHVKRAQNSVFTSREKADRKRAKNFTSLLKAPDWRGLIGSPWPRIAENWQKWPI